MEGLHDHSWQVAGLWIALSVAVIAGTKALIDYATGAAKARGALEGMNKTAKEWRDNAAETFYECHRTVRVRGENGMNTEQRKREVSYRVALSIAREMHRRDLMEQKESVHLEPILADKFSPVWSALLRKVVDKQPRQR